MFTPALIDLARKTHFNVGIEKATHYFNFCINVILSVKALFPSKGKGNDDDDDDDNDDDDNDDDDESYQYDRRTAITAPFDFSLIFS